jgi:hypothetical protein
MLSFLDMPDFFANKFSCLRRRRFSFSRVLAGTFDRGVLRHKLLCLRETIITRFWPSGLRWGYNPETRMLRTLAGLHSFLDNWLCHMSNFCPPCQGLNLL